MKSGATLGTLAPTAPTALPNASVSTGTSGGLRATGQNAPGQRRPSGDGPLGYVGIDNYADPPYLMPPPFPGREAEPHDPSSVVRIGPL